MRGKKRKWVKLHTAGWLHGSIRWQLDPAERSVWADIIALAGECGQDGLICDNDGGSIPHDYLAHQLNITVELFEATLEKCKTEGRIINNNGVIKIANWEFYQSEYDRQKPYRDKKKNDDPDKYTKGKYGHLVKRKLEDEDEPPSK